MTTTERFDFKAMRQAYRVAIESVGARSYLELSKEDIDAIYDDKYDELVEAVKRQSFPHRIAEVWIDVSREYFPGNYLSEKLEQDFLRQVFSKNL